MVTRVVILLLFVETSRAFGGTYSTDTTRKSVYFNSFLSGALIGTNEKGNTLSFQTIHGIRKNKLAYGLSIGYDSYIKPLSGGNFFDGQFVHWRAIPMAATVSFDILDKGKNVLFLSGSVGYTRIWTKRIADFGLSFDDKGGMMIHPSIGYRIPSANHHLYFNVGYKWQKNDYRYSYGFGIPSEFWPSVSETMQRLTLTLGFGWN